MKHLLTRLKSASLQEKSCYLVEVELKMDIKLVYSLALNSKPSLTPCSTICRSGMG